jgi:hypothetical protein
MTHISRKVFHELVVLCVYGHGTDPHPRSVSVASCIPDPARFTDPAPVNRAGEIPTTGGMK